MTSEPRGGSASAWGMIQMREVVPRAPATALSWGLGPLWSRRLHWDSYSDVTCPMWPCTARVRSDRFCVGGLLCVGVDLLRQVRQRGTGGV